MNNLNQKSHDFHSIKSKNKSLFVLFICFSLSLVCLLIFVTIKGNLAAHNNIENAKALGILSKLISSKKIERPDLVFKELKTLIKNPQLNKLVSEIEVSSKSLETPEKQFFYEKGLSELNQKLLFYFEESIQKSESSIEHFIIVFTLFLLAVFIFYQNRQKTVNNIIKEVLDENLTLLNHMKQSLFTIDSDLKIVTPVSKFSESIFGKNIIGKNVFDVVYRNLSKDSSEYSGIKSFLSVVFGEDELQWDLENHNLINKVTLNTENEEKILKINYTPFRNESDQLEKIMFVIEDFTQVEKLERELIDQQKTLGVDVIIIRELAQSEISDIRDFFKHAPFYLSGSQNLLMQKNNVEFIFNELLRNIHTLKGNSRLLKLDFLAETIHASESKIKDLSKPDIGELSEDILNGLKENLNNIQLTFNRYLSMAEKVFKIENEFKKSLVFQLNQSMISFDALMLNEYIENDKDLLKKVQNIKEVSTAKEISQKISFLMNSLGEKDISRISNNISLFFENPTNSTVSFGLEEIIKIKRKVIEIYNESGVFKSYYDGPEYWGVILNYVTELFSKYQKNNNSFINSQEIVSSLQSLWSFGNAEGLIYIEYLAHNLLSSIEEKSDDKANKYLKELLHYLLLIFNLNIDRNADKKCKDEIIKILSSTESNWDPSQLIKFRYGQISIITFLRIIERYKLNTPQFFKDFLSFTDHKNIINCFPSLLPDKKLSQDEVKSIQQNIKNLKLTPSFFPKKNWNFLFDAVLFKAVLPLNTLILIDLLQLFDALIESGKSNKKKAGLQIVEVVGVNINKMRNALSDLKKSFEKENFLKLEKVLNHLLDLPLKKKLYDFKSMVEEIAGRLGKKVDFIITGDDVLFNRDQVTLLSDSLVHIFRNIVDHGIELPLDRKNQGKNEIGLIEVMLKQQDNNIILTISDDGKGIQVKKIKQKAKEQNLMPLETLESLSPGQVINLIFLPNFSTADAVTELSGRGVGMNVVKEYISKLNGTILVESEEGKGTHFIISLPSV